MKIRIYKTVGKHPNIGWWCVLAITPLIAIGRVADFVTETPVYCLNIKWLFWELKINNRKNY